MLGRCKSTQACLDIDPLNQSDEETFEFTIGPEHAGGRIDKVLRDLVPRYSRTYLKELIEMGCVSIGAEVVTKSRQLVEEGDVVKIRLVPKKEAAAAPKKFPLEVLFEDNFLAVINKPAGIPTHRGIRQTRGTIADAAVELFGPDLPRGQGEDRPGIVHRLDRETSGVMLLAKNEEAFYNLQGQFKARTVKKEYRAIVRGTLRFDSDHVEGLMARDARQPDKMRMSKIAGRESSTFYQVLERFENFTYLRCEPKTGRTHQIRVHLTHLGHPLVGDKVYKASGIAWHTPHGAPKVWRHLLHAHRLTFEHPKTGDSMHFEAPIPKDMQDFLNFLRKSDVVKE